MAVLDEVAHSSPDACWWLKADGCNITKGLKESVKLQWSGDADLNVPYKNSTESTYKWLKKQG